jgi:predicted DNA-binding protein
MSVQISAYVEEEVKERMERYASAHGLKKGFLIQNALDHYLSALEDLPGSEIVPARITVDRESWERHLAAEDKEPTPRLKALLDAD